MRYKDIVKEEKTNMVEVRFRETHWQSITPPRTLNDWEHAVLNFLLSEPFTGRDKLQEQAGTVRVSAECRCCLSIELTGPAGSPRQLSNSHHGHVDMAMVADLEGVDTDGTPMWALLFVQGGRLAELEIQRADGRPFTRQPNISRFEIVPRRKA